MIADPFLLTVIACAALTIAVRALPIVFLAGVSLPRFALDWLGFVPCAIMVAIVILELAGNADKPGGLLPALLASLVATLLALFTRSLFATVLGGVGFYLAWFLLG